MLRQLIPFSHAPTQSGLNPGRRTRVEPGLSVSVSHGNLYHCVRIAIIDEKMAFGVWFFRVIVLLSILWLRRRHAARRRSLLACDMAWRARIRRRRAARARRRLLLYESMSRQLSTAYLQRRTVWVRHRSRSFWYEIAGNWSEREWKQNLRVNRATFHFLCRELQTHLERSDAVRTPLPLEQRVAICLWRLGTNFNTTKRLPCISSSEPLFSPDTV